MKTWNDARLDALLRDFERRVSDGIADERREETPETESVARVLGFWMMRLLDSKTDGGR